MRSDHSQEPLELDEDELEPLPDEQPSPYQATHSLQSVDMEEYSSSAAVVRAPTGARHAGVGHSASGQALPQAPGPLLREPTEPSFDPDAYAQPSAVNAGSVARGPGSMASSGPTGSGFEDDPPTGHATRQGRISDMRRNPTPSRRTGPPRPAHVPPAEPPQRKPSRRRRRDDPKIDNNLGRVLGSYRILTLIGAGGMGQVYMAEHTMLGRKVALKLLRPEYAVKRDAVHRFFQEARAVNAIGHENIVDITDYVELDSGETFFIMELLEGQDLSDYLRKSDKPMPLHQAMQIALQICEALYAAHQTNIIHRDLKPDNVFVVNSATKRWFVKLLDFGVAKLQGDAAEDASYQTAAGSVIGTPAYMSPEQASGLPVDHRTDIYSLGAILYEMFTGHPVFRAKSFGEFVVKHMNDQPVPPRDLANAPKIPAALEAVILRCLEKDPNARYQSVAELREDLTRATATVETAVRTIAPPSASKRSRGNLLLVPIIVGVLALAVGAFLWASGMLGGDDGPPAGAGRATSGSGSVSTAPLPAGQGRAAATVQLQLESKPAGAQVFELLASGKQELIGKTPYTLRRPRAPEGGKKTITLVFRLDGHRDIERTVALSNQVVEALLELETDDVVTDPSPSKASTGKRKRRRKRRSGKTAKGSDVPKVVDPDKTPAKPDPPTKPTPRKPTKPKKINKTDQVDPFAQ